MTPRLIYPDGPALPSVCRFCNRRVWLAPVDGVKTQLEYSPLSGLEEELDKVLIGLRTYAKRGEYAALRLPEDLDGEACVHAQHRCSTDPSPEYVVESPQDPEEPEECPF